MKIKDVLQRDPATHPLVNQGQARIADKPNEKVLEELRGELSTFVCEGQYSEGIQRILSSYLANLGQTSQKAAWISGFFGSGKSHVLKMLCHLWQDTRFPDGSTARSLVPSMPDEVRNLLRELDTAGKRAGGLLAAPGSLPSGSTENVRLTVLAVLLRAVGMPDQYAQARFCIWLYEQGYLEPVRASVEGAGKEWGAELNDLYVSSLIARAVLVCDPNFAKNEAEARTTIRETFPQPKTDITTAEFLTVFKRSLQLVAPAGRLPCTVLGLDEVQQYIGDSNDRSMLLTEVVEAVSKQLDSQVIIVGAGQSALTDVPLLHKMMDRFAIRVPLSDTDVETVTRKVLLQKKPAAIGEVQKALTAHSGEISRQLQGTRIGESVEDRRTIVDDYPLLPVRRRFWEHCFRQIDAAGTQSQLRSQLRIIHDAVAKISEKPISTLVPGDELYEALAPEMVNTGVLLREINERIINLSKDGTPEGILDRRICGTVFLIGKLPREAGADTGVRATKDHIADLLVDDLAADNGKLRNSVESSLERLYSQAVLMRVGDEYRLQTKEGGEWDSEFRVKQRKLGGDDADLQLRRDALLYAEADRIIRAQKVTQGAAKEPRQLTVYRDQNPPQILGDSIPVWIRDGWSCAEKEVVDAARVAGSDGPIIYIFIPRQSANDLRTLIIEADAAQQTIDARGNPATDEGREARQSMISRRDAAEQKRSNLVKDIIANAKVYQGGGSELLQLSLEDKLREGATASLVRLYPRFKEADAPGSAWEAVIKRARDGSDQPFQPVGYTGSVEQHPVCQQMLAEIGAGKTGLEVRKNLKTAPYGWPQDAVDAALIALHRSQHVSAKLNGASVALGQLDQNKISKSEFRVERATLSVNDRLVIRKLFTLLVPCKSGEEIVKAAEFLDAAVSLARDAGGAPPLPLAPSIADIENLRKLDGNERLLAIKNKATELEGNIGEWKKLKGLCDQRSPAWRIAERLAKHATSVPGAADPVAQVEAIRDELLLLNSTDPVAPVRASLATLLRQALNDVNAKHEDAYRSTIESLDQNETWSAVPETERTRILFDVGLEPAGTINTSTDEDILGALDDLSLAARRAECDAIPGRAQRALELAARYIEPKVRVVSLERATLRSEGDVREWVARQEALLIDAVKQGPILIN